MLEVLFEVLYEQQSYLASEPKFIKERWTEGLNKKIKLKTGIKLKI
jgi:hypothetical protein